MPLNSIFISYSHADTRQLDRLLKHLGVLKSAVEFQVWTDKEIAGGDDWLAEIDKVLTSSVLAILLVSADFLSSRFIESKEVPDLLQRHKKEGLRVYPILAKACAWEAVPWLDAIQIRPVGAKPVWRSSAQIADAELARITMELLALVRLALSVQPPDAAARAAAEQQRAQKEQEIHELIAAAPPVDALFAPASPLHVPLNVETLDSSDSQKAQEIYRQILADAGKNKAERERIQRDLQEKIFAVLADVPVKGTHTSHTILTEMDKYIRGDI